MTSEPTRQSIQDYLRQCEAEMVEFLKEMVLVESPSVAPETQAQVFAQLCPVLEESGFRISRLPGRRSGGLLYAESNSAGPSGETQLLLGHTDTVWPLGSLKEMPVQLGDGILSGPGVYDMKGGLTQLLYALKTINALGLKPSVTPLVLLNSDEEIGSYDSRPHICRLAGEANRVFVLEPSLGKSGRLKTARKGVGRYTVRVRGKAAHAGLEPQSGASAILEASHVVQKLFDLNDGRRGISVNVGTIEGGIAANVIAPECSAEVDVRVPTLDSAQRIEEAIRGLQPETGGVRLEVKGGLEQPPMEPTRRNRYLWKAAQAAAVELGLDLQEGTAGGGSDGNFTSQYTATLDGLGAVGGGAHATHEFVIVEKLTERTALLVLLLLAPPIPERILKGKQELENGYV